MTNLKLVAVVALGVALFSGPALGQEPNAPPSTPEPTTPTSEVLRSDREDLIDAFQIDTSIPEAAGFSAIGVSPTEVLDPGVARVTFASLLNYVDENGDLKPGFALGGAPYWWFRTTTLEEYRTQTSPFERALARTEISAAYAPGDETDGDRVGLGFSTELLGSSDYRLNRELYSCSARAIDGVYGPALLGRGVALSDFARQAASEWNAWRAGTSQLPDISDQSVRQIALANPEAGGLWRTARESDLSRADNETRIDQARGAGQAAFTASLKACQDKATAEFASRRSLTVAGGLALRQESGTGSSYESDGGSVWAVYRHPFELAGTAAPNYIGFFGRHDFDRSEEVTPGVDQSFDKTTLAALVGYEQGTSKMSLQAGWETVNFDVGPQVDDGYFFYTLSYDYRVAPNVWLTLRGGSRGDQKSVADENDEYFLFSIKWGPGTNLNDRAN